MVGFLFLGSFFLRWGFASSEWLSWTESFHSLELPSCSWSPYVCNDFNLYFSGSQKTGCYTVVFHSSRSVWLDNQGIKTNSLMQMAYNTCELHFPRSTVILLNITTLPTPLASSLNTISSQNLCPIVPRKDIYQMSKLRHRKYLSVS